MRRLAAHSPVGMTRVEAHVLRAALLLPADRVGFCTLDRYQGVMKDLCRVEVEKLLARYGASPGSSDGGSAAATPGRRARGTVRAALRTLERNVRGASRALVGRARNSLRLPGDSVCFAPGDALVLSGGTWDLLEARSLERIVDRQGVRLVAILADMIPWRFPHHFQDQVAVDRFLEFATLLASRAALVLSISRATDDDFRQFATASNLQPGELGVIQLGADPARSDGVAPPNLPDDLLRRGFVLSVSTMQVRKNHQLLYQLWRRLAEERCDSVPRLVLAGAAGWLTEDLRAQLHRDPLVRDSVRVLHRVDDRQLAWLYAHARFTVYPSIYEGWGLPIVESLQYGKPCIASATSSMPEASGGLAVHLDPLDFAAWHRAVLAWVDSPDSLAAAAARIRTSFVPRSWKEFSHELADRLWVVAQSRSGRAA